MAYNSVFPTTYQPINYQQQPIIQQPQVATVSSPQQQSQNNPMIWVQGETGAKSYLLAPNTTLPLWDSENQTIYLKSADASGMPSMKILDYTIRDSAQTPAPVMNEETPVQNIDFVTQEEFKKFERSIRSQIRNLTKKENKSNE